MTDGERCFLTEARAILAGTTMILPQKEHLEALDEQREITIIRMANALEVMKQRVLNGEEA